MHAHEVIVREVKRHGGPHVLDLLAEPVCQAREPAHREVLTFNEAGGDKGETSPWHIPNDDQRVINLEHVLPERPQENWAQFSDDEVKIFRNRIGNLALLQASDNSALGSCSYAEKRPVLLASPYGTTSQIAEAETWTPAKIDERQKVLAMLALKAWPI